MSDKIKTLADAIRLGSTFRPQCHLALYREGRSCALGAAGEALGVQLHEPHNHDLWDTIWEAIEKRCGRSILCRKVFDPITGDKGRLVTIITKLNDICLWSREEIADWVQQQEEQHGQNKNTI